MYMNNAQVLTLEFIQEYLRNRFKNKTIALTQADDDYPVVSYMDPKTKVRGIFRSSLNSEDIKKFSLIDLISGKLDSFYSPDGYLENIEMIEKSKRMEFDVHLDLETSLFNKIQEIDGKLEHGARVGTIFELYAKILPLGSSSEGYYSGQHHYILDDSDWIQDIENLKFHISTGFLEKYKEALNNEKCLGLKEVDEALVGLLKVVCEEHNIKLKPYGQTKEVVFRLVGKSTFFDMDFIQQKLPKFSMYLSHEIKDMSAFKNFYREVVPGFMINENTVAHTAKEDVEQDILSHNDIRTFFKHVSKLTYGSRSLKEVNARLEALSSQMDGSLSNFFSISRADLCANMMPVSDQNEPVSSLDISIQNTAQSEGRSDKK